MLELWLFSSFLYTFGRPREGFLQRLKSAHATTVNDQAHYI
jgi:hypothetical protein